ncbi:MAG: hypothetical protein JWO08_4732 [Verrucomicrobiaceae bacterium]|nr:hypothetical protein [Verrucomicrobiaceae bacterium]
MKTSGILLCESATLVDSEGLITTHGLEVRDFPEEGVIRIGAARFSTNELVITSECISSKALGWKVLLYEG